jgi:hypothetical protein
MIPQFVECLQCTLSFDTGRVGFPSACKAFIGSLHLGYKHSVALSGCHQDLSA